MLACFKGSEHKDVEEPSIRQRYAAPPAAPVAFSALVVQACVQACVLSQPGFAFDPAELRLKAAAFVAGCLGPICVAQAMQ